MSLVDQALERWKKTEDGVIYGGLLTNEELRKVFEAGWNAARAETRSDAAQASGGRSLDLDDGR
jgi:hypothetical protein